MSEQLRQQLKTLITECIQHPHKLDTYTDKIINLFEINNEYFVPAHQPSSRRSSSIFDGPIPFISQRRHSSIQSTMSLGNHSNSVFYDYDGID